MAIRDYTDERGILRKVAVPESFTGDLKRGIPISLNVDSVFEEMPISFLQRLYPAFYQRGIVTYEDTLQPGAAGRIQAAILSVVSHDALNIQALAKGVLGR